MLPASDLALAAGIAADAQLIDTLAEASAFGAMKAKAADYAPVGGTGYSKSDANFFDSGSSRKWEGALSAEHMQACSARLQDLIPDTKARAWLETGEAQSSAAR